MRLNAKSFAITAWTNVPKESVMNYIKHEFGIENIQYICIGEELSELHHRRHLHIQIIFKEKIDRRKLFLDDITETHCNYQVTRNDCAWNEYIKKGDNYTEFNEFKSTKTRGGQKQWPPSSSSHSSLSASSSSHTLPNIPIHSKITTTITTTYNNNNNTRAEQKQEKQKQKQKEAIARHAFNLAKTNIHDALIFMRDNSITTDFLRYSNWYEFYKICLHFSFDLNSLRYKNTFTLIYLLEQYEMDKIDNIVKEYTWPESFSDCTPSLRTCIFQLLIE